MELTQVERNIKIERIALVFERKMKSDFVFTGEMHDFWEFLYVEDGIVCVSADENVYDLKAGEIIFHKPMEFHKFRVDGKAKIFVMSFAMSGSLSRELEGRTVRLSAEQRDMLYNIISILRETGTDERDGWTSYEWIFEGKPLVGLQIVSLCEAFFIALCIQSTPVTDRPVSFETEIFRRTVLMMEDNIYDWITSDDIAYSLNISVSYLKKIFSKYAGLGIHKYFLKSKITLACKLLREGKSVSDVSELLNFSSHNYFSTVFKRETGRLPSEFKGETK